MAIFQPFRGFMDFIVPTDNTLKARTTDPQTSHSAATRATPKAASDRAIVFSAICDAGQAGATFKDVSRMTGLAQDRCWRRCSDLLAKGLIIRTRIDLSEFGTPDVYETRDGCAVYKKA